MNQAQEQRVNLEITPDSNLPQKIVTEQLNLDLIKILGNLIDNSLAAIKDSGKITLAINFDSESSVLIIEVADTGTGISSEVKKHLFKQKYSTKGKDHGYGLILVQQIIKSYSGHLEVSSCKPHGSNFYIELPLQEKNEKE